MRQTFHSIKNKVCSKFLPNKVEPQKVGKSRLISKSGECLVPFVGLAKKRHVLKFVIG